jgi:tetratricopeptide (TPR) repeat protein
MTAARGGGKAPNDGAPDETREKVRYHLQKGIRHFRAAEYRQSARDMKKALQLDPEDLTAQQYLGEVREINATLKRAVQFYNVKDFNGCLDAVRRVLELNPGDLNAAALSAKLPELMGASQGTPPSSSDIGLAPIWTGTHSTTTRTAAKGQGRKTRWPIWAAIIVMLVQIPAFIYIYLRQAKDESQEAKQKAERVEPPAKDPLDLAKQALEMVRKDRFAFALGLLDAAKGSAKQAPLVMASLREQEVKIRLEMGQRLLASGNEIAAKNEFELVLHLSPGDSGATNTLAAIKKRSAMRALKGTKIMAAVVPESRLQPRRPKRRGKRKRPKRVAMVTPTPAPAQAMVFVFARPPGVAFIDGTRLGSTPINAHRVKPGPHKLVVRAEGFEPTTRSFNAQAGEKVDLNVTLVRKAVPQPRRLVVAPTPKPKPTPAPTPKPAVVKRPEVPTLRLPVKLVIRVYRSTGQRSTAVRAVCVGVERTVSKAVGKSAAGLTTALQNHIYSTSSADTRVTMYPRAMGYLIAQALVEKKGGISHKLVKNFKSGRLASLTRSNWRP